MRISLDALLLRDFKSFRGRHLLDIGSMPIGLHFLKGVNRVSEGLGSNGSGKSSLWDALCWCLYGRTVEGLRNPDIRSWGGPSSSVVSVTLVVDDEPRCILRQTSPNRLFIDGEEVGQDQVDALVGMGYKTFLHAVLLGQGQPLFLDLTSGEMLTLFSEVLNLGRWEQRSALAAEKIATLGRSQMRREASLELIKASITDLRGQIASVKQQSKDWALAQREKKEALRRAQFKARSVDEEARRQLEQVELEEDMASTQFRLAKDNFEAEFQKLFGLRDVMTLLATEWSNECDKESRIKAKLETMGADAGVCPACGQEIRAAALKKTIGGLRRSLAEIAKSDTARRLKASRKAYDEQDKRIDTMRSGMDSLEESAKTLGRRVAELRVEVRRNEARIKERVTEIVALKEVDNPFMIQRDKLREKLRISKESLEDEKLALDKLQRRIARTKFWVKGFKDIRLQVLGDVLDELQITSNAMLAEIGLTGWSLRFSIERETKSGSITPGIDVEVNSPTKKDPTKWRSWSGGERQRLRMVVSLALSEILLRHAGLRTDFVILDEPTQHLSDAGIADLCEVLAGYAQDHKRKVFYTDHHSTESGMFSSVITVEKTDKGSCILSS